ncbi:MAG: hypothetical protein N3D78_02220 [Candidatus Aenigmarchaeota archaeon]|nr:hypothetical protein [Candidatus Aenigmarchaeota archaeon]
MPMTLGLLKNLLIKPHETLPKIKESSDTTVAQMLLNWILVGIGIGIVSEQIVYSLAAIVGGIVAQTIFTLFLKAALMIAGGKGQYRDVLSSTTYPFFGLSLIIPIISLIGKTNPLAGIGAATILVTLYSVVALVGFLTMLRNSFKLDLITLWVILSLVIMAMTIAAYVSIGLFSIIPGLKYLTISDFINYFSF